MQDNTIKNLALDRLFQAKDKIWEKSEKDLNVKLSILCRYKKVDETVSRNKEINWPIELKKQKYIIFFKLAKFNATFVLSC